jgi:hypothetical protein
VTKLLGREKTKKRKKKTHALALSFIVGLKGPAWRPRFLERPLQFDLAQGEPLQEELEVKEE